MALTAGDVVVMDMEAGLEHLGRGTAKGFDALICVVEPGLQSIETASRIDRLAREIGIRDVLFVGNKVMTDQDGEFIRKALGDIGLNLICLIPFDRNILRADVLRVAPIDLSPDSPAIAAIKELEEVLKERYG